ncbi:MAG TPA: hypothetical protein VD815_02635 [Candidatus Saccharimonadales bacterium]|nr:hypothetical protein [Candidatus Saccharimonadales bacterium]
MVNLNAPRNKVILIVLLSIGFTMVMYFVINFSLNQQSTTFARLIPEEAYIIILHEVFNEPLNDLRNVTFDDLRGKFTAQYVMVDGDGTIYQANKDSHETSRMIGKIDEPLSGGSHFGWEIISNDTKYYVDSTSGEIVTIVNSSNQ